MPGTLNGTKCYLAGNLEFGDWDHAASWREQFEKDVSGLGIKVLSPLKQTLKNYPTEIKGYNATLKLALSEGYFDWVHEQSKLIRGKDLYLCDVATFLVINLDPTKPTFGTVDELITSSRAKKPIFLCMSGGYKNIPIWLAGYIKPEFVFDSLNKIVDKLKQLDNLEPSELDKKYWRLLEKEYQ